MIPNARKNPGRVGSGAINLARMELTTLRLVAVCASVGSVTHAAPLCNMSTMCASRRIQMLEEILGFALFYRRRSGLELTAAGRVVAERSATILQWMEDMVSAAQQAPRPTGELFENCGRTRKPGKHPAPPAR